MNAVGVEDEPAFDLKKNYTASKSLQKHILRILETLRKMFARKVTIENSHIMNYTFLSWQYNLGDLFYGTLNSQGASSST